MGTAGRSAKVNSAPVYAKSVLSTPTSRCILYRGSHGTWGITDLPLSKWPSATHPFVKDGGNIFSKWGAALPSEKGLIWTYHDGENFVDDTDITCDVANSTRRA